VYARSKPPTTGGEMNINRDDDIAARIAETMSEARMVIATVFGIPSVMLGRGTGGEMKDETMGLTHLRRTESMFMGRSFDYWLELQRQADMLSISDVIEENARLRAKLLLYERLMVPDIEKWSTADEHIARAAIEQDNKLYD
jgi:hypothetical protein